MIKQMTKIFFSLDGAYFFVFHLFKILISYVTKVETTINLKIIFEYSNCNVLREKYLNFLCASADIRRRFFNVTKKINEFELFYGYENLKNLLLKQNSS